MAHFVGIQIAQSDQFFHFQFTHAQLSHVVYCTFVYGKHSQAEREVLWADLLSLQGTVSHHPWLLGGDFNSILMADDYRGSATPDSASMFDFNQFLSQTDLREPSVTRGTYTWTGVRRRGRFGLNWIEYF